jgi:hypothetical protein
MFSHHDRHLQALPAVFARTSEAQRSLQDAYYSCQTERASEMRKEQAFIVDSWLRKLPADAGVI